MEQSNPENSGTRNNEEMLLEDISLLGKRPSVVDAMKEAKRLELQRQRVSRHRAKKEGVVISLQENIDELTSAQHLLEAKMVSIQKESEEKILSLNSCHEKQLQTCLHFAYNGFTFLEQVNAEHMEEFIEEIVTQSAPSGTITGYYNMKAVRTDKLMEREATKRVIEPILSAAQKIFTSYLQKPVEVEINSSAILSSPPVTYTGPPMRAQVMHADNVGFAAISVIIMLSRQGGRSTHIVNAREHGRDQTLSDRDLMLDFHINHLDPPTNPREYRPPAATIERIKAAIQARYGHLLNLTPTDFFKLAESIYMQFGDIEMFRSDLLHAGPFSSEDREVLFLEIRVKGEARPEDKDFQYRFPNLLQISGADADGIKAARRVWSIERYMFPEDFENIDYDDVFDESQLYEAHSVLPNHNGLFCQVDIPLGTNFAIFNNETILTDAELAALQSQGRRGDDQDYLCYVKKDVTYNCWQARKDGRCKASMANCCLNLRHADGKVVTSNCRITRGKLPKANVGFTAYLKATRFIEAGEEILVDTYGREYSSILNKSFREKQDQGRGSSGRKRRTGKN